MKLIIRAIATQPVLPSDFLTIAAVSGRNEQEHGIKKIHYRLLQKRRQENLLTKKYNVTDKNQLEADFLETLSG